MVIPAAEETLKAFLVSLVVVVHVGPAAGAARDGATRLCNVLQFRVDRVDETTHWCPIPVVEGQRGGHIAIRELKGSWIVFRILGVLLELLLTLFIIHCLLRLGIVAVTLLCSGVLPLTNLLPLTHWLGFSALLEHSTNRRHPRV